MEAGICEQSKKFTCWGRPLVFKQIFDFVPQLQQYIRKLEEKRDQPPVLNSRQLEAVFVILLLGYLVAFGVFLKENGSTRLLLFIKTLGS